MMARRMSCAMTIDAVRDRTKTVTRRHVDTWRTLQPGDRLTLVEKGMGLPKGAKQVVLAEVEVTDVRVEPLGLVDADEVHREGVADMAAEVVFGSSADEWDGQSPRFDTMADWFIWWWAGSHGYGRNLHPAIAADIECRRIEWRYIDVEDGDR